MDDQRIVSDPEVMLGKPCVRGTRLTVEYILDALASGRSIDDLLAGHGKLSREDVLTALAFAAGSVRLDAVRPVASV
jgi:uncharacterized protein (DUF433 family)